MLTIMDGPLGVLVLQMSYPFAVIGQLVADDLSHWDHPQTHHTSGLILSLLGSTSNLPSLLQSDLVPEIKQVHGQLCLTCWMHMWWFKCVRELPPIITMIYIQNIIKGHCFVMSLCLVIVAIVIMVTRHNDTQCSNILYCSMVSIMVTSRSQ